MNKKYSRLKSEKHQQQAARLLFSNTDIYFENLLL